MKPILFFSCLLLFLATGCKQNNKKQSEVPVAEPLQQKSVEQKAEVEHDTILIVPGKSIGNIVLNADAKKTISLYGKPDFQDAAMGKEHLSWKVQKEKKPYNLAIFTARKMGVEDFSRIKLIRTNAATYQTKNKLGVEASLGEIRQEFILEKVGSFKENGEQFTLYDTDKGIAFEIDENQKCSGILLHLIDQKATAFYLPMYRDFKKE